MSEKILKIDIIKDFAYEYSSMDGFKVITDKQEILILICNSENCCENSGYFQTNDSTSEFIGADLFEMKLTDICLNAQLMKQKFEYGLDEGGIQFVDLITSKGILQFAVYNEHNGYYGHNILIKSNTLNHEKVL